MSSSAAMSSRAFGSSNAAGRARQLEFSSMLRSVSATGTRNCS
jgi:hypothetical protein